MTQLFQQNKQTVLVVDDDPDILELMEYNLSTYGFNVITSTSGLEAIWNLANEEKPDCIILDIMMPSPDGFELCAFLKSSAEFKKIPIIIVSARGTEEDIRRGLSLGADAYFPKGQMGMASLLEFVTHYTCPPAC